MILGQHQAQQMPPPVFIVLQQAPQQKRLSRQHLQAILNVSINLIEKALQAVKSICWVEGISGGELVKKLMQIQKFREWLKSNQSQVLLLRIDESGRPITSLSSVCSTLLASLQDLDPAVTLHYFCGAFREDSAQGRFHLLRSLIVQTLERWPAERTFAMNIDYGQLFCVRLQRLAATVSGHFAVYVRGGDLLRDRRILAFSGRG
ncbi:hypothetical protein CSAL01_02851 [Colletotrichum salicis]|uniref:Nephrocystin 3-like N-terminal domain-containing protein n=1 Tax=Colletotrichum salicis TaxID=1209931 RepID=A0A135SI93_9PEZI|nr:hypothetical protein CSAL01_02851 [Colletotrichum salicis]